MQVNPLDIGMSFAKIKGEENFFHSKLFLKLVTPLELKFLKFFIIFPLIYIKK